MGGASDKPESTSGKDGNYDELIVTIREIQKSLEEKKKEKDGWDKTGIVAQIISSIVLVVAGLFVTYHLGHGQHDIEAGDLEATNRKIVGDYLNGLMATRPEIRPLFLDAIDVEMGPNFSVPLAIRLKKPRPLRSMICLTSDGHHRQRVTSDPGALEELEFNRQMNEGADELLERLSRDPDALSVMKKIKDSSSGSDATIATAYLSGRSEVSFKVSEVDDSVDISINHKNIGTYQSGIESDWIPITKFLVRGKVNTLHIVVNNIKEAAGVRLRMQIGGHQYDKYFRTRNFEPSGAVFDLSVAINVSKTGVAEYGGDDITNKGMKTGESCPYTY